MSTATRFPTITPEALPALRARIGQPVRRPEPYIEVATRDAIRHWAHGIGDRNPFWAGAGVAPPTILFAMDRVVSGYVGGQLRRLSAQVRRHNLIGDVSWCRGIVTGKREEDGLALVDVDLVAENQRGDITAKGSATVAPPRRRRS
jgi:hypothetical protein